jgi:Asp-tRNA(Asn)/Glu-tRNA(Gln) amidotransferase A subunit family amidase
VCPAHSATSGPGVPAFSRQEISACRKSCGLRARGEASCAARRRAAEADQALARGQVWGPLHGVGVTVADHHATAGMRSTFGGYPRLLNIEHHQIPSGTDASMAPGFETAESAAATKQSADYWARG